MLKEEYKEASKEEKEAFKCKFVTDLISSTERQLMPIRQRQMTAFNLFNGIMEWDQSRIDSEWQSKPFIHELSVIVREAAAGVVELLFQQPKFFDLVEGNDTSGFSRELTRILEKLLVHEFDRSGFESLVYRYCLMGGITGAGIFKHYVDYRAEYRPEIIMEQITKELEAHVSSLSSDIMRPTYEVSEDEGVVTGKLADAMAKIQAAMGEDEGPTIKREIGPKKVLRTRICSDIVNPINFFCDPDVTDMNASGWHAERIFKKLYQLDSAFTAGVLDSKKRKQLVESMGGKATYGVPSSNTSFETQKLVLKDNFTGSDAPSQMAELLEFFGSIYSDDGELLEENRHIIVANGKVLLKDEPNCYFNQKSPYHIAVFSQNPEKQGGTGVADNGIDQQIIINNLTGLWLDMLYLATYEARTVDTSKIQDPSQISGGLKPGQLIDTYGSAADEVFSSLKTDVSIAPQVFQTLEMMRLSNERAASVDTASANPSSRARISASEIQANVNRSNRSSSILGRELDTNMIEAAVRSYLELILQFGFSYSSLQDYLSDGVLSQSEFELITNIPPVERFREARRNYKVQIKGFRAKLAQEEFLSKINEMMSVMGRLPPNTVPIQWKELVRQWFDAYGFDTDKLIAQDTPQDKAREENFILANDQMISIGQQDDHAAELTVHYEQVGVSPTPSLAAHIVAHFQTILEQGGKPPQIPPDVEQFLTEAGLIGPPPGEERPGEVEGPREDVAEMGAVTH